MNRLMVKPMPHRHARPNTCGQLAPRGRRAQPSPQAMRMAPKMPSNLPSTSATPIPTEPVFIKAGQHKVAATFVRRFDGPYEDLIRPHDWSYAGGGSGGTGITTLPHLRDLLVKGPYRTTGISETPSRKKIFSCRPTTSAEERPCARTIVTRLGGEAYRRPLTTKEVDAIMPFYGRAAGARLTQLLRGHILVAVEVLTAAKAGNTSALARAQARWSSNGAQIADFLSAANPTAWPKAVSSPARTRANTSSRG